MFLRDVLLPRSILVNAALYAVFALLYTIIFFALEITNPGKYIFSSTTDFRDMFSYLVICSWPILLFGALILIAVRVGGNVRRRRRRRKHSTKSRHKTPVDSFHSSRRQPPSTIPPAHPAYFSSIPRNASQESVLHSNPNSFPRNPSAVRSKPSTTSSKLPRVEKGFVSVTPLQRFFAALGFLWVSVGLAGSAAAAVIVFLGQKERYEEEAKALGIDPGVLRKWIIPIVCGVLMAVVFTILSVTTMLKVISTLAAKGREVDTPAPSENDDSIDELDDEDMLFVDGEPTAPPLTPSASVAQPQQPTHPAPVVRGRVRMGNKGYHPTPALPVQPDQKTVDRLMRQLRDMGFRNAHQNLAALQASSFDLERSSEKLMNAQVAGRKVFNANDLRDTR